MSNNGLKNKSEIIKRNVGNTDIFCNLSKFHGNVSLRINLLSTLGANKTDFFLYYNEYNSINIGFGKGFTCNFYRKIVFDNNKYIMTTYDGLKYEFSYISLNRYYNEELSQEILKQANNSFYILDGFGNRYFYNSVSLYPISITIGESGYSISLVTSNDLLTEIKVYSNTRVVSTINITYTNINNQYYATTLTCTKPNNTYSITYNSGLISSISSHITGENNLLSNMSYSICTYDMTILDNITHKRCKMFHCPDDEFQSIDVYKIEDDSFINNTSIDKLTTLINHEHDYVKIYDNYGNSEYLYYERENIGYIFNGKEVRKCIYDENDTLTSIYSPIEIDKNIINSYNLIKNGFFEQIPYLSNWTVSGTSSYSIMTDSSRPLSNLLGDKYLKILSESFDCSLQQQINIRGSEIDNYTLALWVNVLSLGVDITDDFKIELEYYSKLYGIDTLVDTFEVIYPHKSLVTNKWFPLVFDVSPHKNFDKVILKLSLLNVGLELGLDGILLVNSKVKNEISYFEHGKKEYEENKDDVINYIHNYYDEYNETDKLGMIIDSDGKVTRYEYDNDCYNVIEEVSQDKTINKTYDANEKNNLLNEVILSNGKRLVKEYTYTPSKDYIHTIKDYDGTISSFYTDEARGNITNEIYSNGQNMLSVYDSLDRTEIKEISGNNFLKELDYSYENNNALNEIIMNNNYKYDFNYTNEKLTQVKVNNLVLESIRYKNTYPYSIEEITKGINGDKVKFEYNNDGTLSNVYYKCKGESIYSLKYHYSYSNKHLINSRTTSSGGGSYYEREYEYDSLGHLVKVFDPNNLNLYNEYLFDEDFLNIKNIDSLSKKRLEVNNNTNKEFLATKSDLRDSLLYQTKDVKKYYTFFDKTIHPTFLVLYTSLNSSQGVKKSIGNDCSFTINNDNGNKYVSLTNSSSFLKYLVPSEYYESGILKKGSFGFLFKTNSLNNIKTIFSLFDCDSSSRIVIQNNSSNVLVLKIYNSNDNFVTGHSFNKKVSINAINYFGISYSIYSNNTKIKIRCVFNNEKYDFDEDDMDGILTFNHFSIGSLSNDTLSKSTINLYSIMASPGNHLSISELFKCYHLQKDVYEAALTITNRSSMNTFISNVVDNLTDFIPLTSSFISRNKRKPVHLNYRYDEECIRNKYFKYIDSISNYMLKLDGINLVYDLDLGETFTVGMNVIFNNIYNTDYIFRVVDGVNSIGLFVKDDYLYIDSSNNLTNTNISVTRNTLYFISFGIDFVFLSDSLTSSYYKVRVVVNNNSYETTVASEKINSKLLIVGSKGMNEEVDHFMDGYINLLCYSNTYMSVSSISTLQNELRPIITETVLDSFERINKTKVIKGSLKLEKTLNYKQVVGSDNTYNDTLFIESEVVLNQNNNTLLQRSYKYGTGYSYGNITEVRENNTLINSYFYNQKGYLISSYYYTLGYFNEYTYDNNGNITEKLTRLNSDGSIINDTFFLYDNVWPDRLVQVGNKKVEYDTDSIGCPKHYGYFTNNTFTSGITYKWRLSKLIGLTDSINNIIISYDYNEDGNRIEKVVTNTTNNSSSYHYYYYEGNRLLTEIIDFSNRLDFLYDEANNIIGFDYQEGNVTSRYFYIKNILGDIIKIVDYLGEVIVEYVYSAYGELLSITGTLSSTIGIINPIRYRSYYYDTDTNMYYLKTRFYNPEWCRFISSDNINYLEYNNPLGVNLFSYCNNNPVMNIDPDGTIIWWALAIVVTVILLTATSCSNNKEKEYEYNQVYSDDDPMKKDAINYKLSYVTVGDTTVPSIKIYNSYNISSNIDKRKILEYIINSEAGQEYGLSSSDIDYYVKEWCAHNFAHRYPYLVALIRGQTVNQTIISSTDVDLNTNDNLASDYRKWWWVFWLN